MVHQYYKWRPILHKLSRKGQKKSDMAQFPCTFPKESN